MKNKRLYAAYGSNMNLEQMAYRCPAAVEKGVGLINNHELYFSYHGVANIQPAVGKNVPVVIWELTPICERALDRYEGYPNLYIKRMVPVVWNGVELEVMAYVLKEPFNRAIEKPSQRYFDCIENGYQSHNLNTEALKALLF